MSSERSLMLADVAATHALAARIAVALTPGSVVALEGDLGAGKTEFVRGLARALGVPAGTVVCSPSYLLLNLYPGGRVPLAHFDAYFMMEVEDLERAGFDELRRAGWAVALEWADRVAAAVPEDAVCVRLVPGRGGRGRCATVGTPRDMA